MSDTAPSTSSRAIGMVAVVPGIAFLGLAALTYQGQDYLIAAWALAWQPCRRSSLSTI